MSQDEALLDVDEFTKQEHLGSGTYGQVFLVEEKKTSKLFAAKVINEETTPDQYIDRELSVFKVIHFPSILGFRGYTTVDFNHQNTVVFFTDYLKNKSLEDVLAAERKNKLEGNYAAWNNTKKMINLIGIALGMRYLHEHGIMHRDLKTANVLLDDNLYPAICDFGLSKCLSDSIEHTRSIGTPMYEAPEVLCDCQYSYPGDVYSYSMIVYAIVTGTQPIIKATIVQLVDQIKNGVRPNRNVIPPQFQDFIDLLWAQDPNERPSFEVICDSLINDRETYWLDDVDEEEVEKYLNRFALTLYKENPDWKDHYLQNLEDDTIPPMAKSSQLDISSDLIAEDMRPLIKYADDCQVDDPETRLKDMEVCYYTGFSFLSGKNGVPIDYYYAFKYLRKAAIMRHGAAIYSLSVLYAMDDENEKSKEIAFTLAKIAATFDNKESFIALGIYFKLGFGCKKNIVMTAINFKIAADMSSADGMMMYAKLLLDIINQKISHEEVSKAEEEALIYMKDFMLLDYYFSESRLAIDTIYNREISRFAANEYIKMAAQLGSRDAIYTYPKIRYSHEGKSHITEIYHNFAKLLEQTS